MITLCRAPTSSYMTKMQAIIAIVMTSVGIGAGAWFGFMMAGWIGAVLFFPFGGGLGYFVSARASIIWDILGAAVSAALS